MRWGLQDRHLYLCTADRPDLATFLQSCILGGVDLVQLRDKTLDDAGIVARARVAHQVCSEFGVPFIVNDRPDLAVLAGADGVHVGQDDMDPTEARRIVGPDRLLGLSTHAPEELPLTDAGVLTQPVDYFSAGPVEATPTKPGRSGTGIEYVTTATTRSPVPVWITGGMTPETVPVAARAGARHFVVVRYLTESDQPQAAAQRLRQAIDEALSAH